MNVTTVESTPPAKRVEEYSPSIDGLRAIAVLSVVGFHAFPEWVKGGFIGVDIFFVISGYLISGIIFKGLTSGRFSFVEFYSRRIRRIFPALIVVFAAALAAGWLIFLPDEYKQLGKHVAGGSGFVSNFVLWNESGYFDKVADQKPFLHLWSLGIEEQFYLLWPFLLWLVARRRTNWLVLTSVLIALPFGVSVYEAHTNAVAAFYSPLSRFWELLIGALLAYATMSPAVVDALERVPFKTRLSNLAAAAGIGLIAAGLVLLTRDSRFPGAWALLPTLGAALLIAAGDRAWINRWLLSNPIVVWCGLISYPLYLWHWTALSVVRIWKNGPVPLPLRTSVVVASVVLASLTYLLIERPIRFRYPTRFVTAALAVLMLGVGVSGYEIFRNDGVGSRLPEVFQDAGKYKFDVFEWYRTKKCFLNPDQTWKTYEAECLPADHTKPVMVLWGDSHAAHLYPGLRERWGGNHEIVQITATSCPPFIGKSFDTLPNCQGNNDFAMSYIARTKPDEVIVSADWAFWNWKEAQRTIENVKAAGVQHVTLIGVAPRYGEGLAREVFMQYTKDPQHRIPWRCRRCDNASLKALDVQMSEYAKSKGINFISLIDILCSPGEGCVARSGELKDTIFSFDSAHLTKSGSTYAVARFPDL